MTEFHDLKLAIKIVDDLDQTIHHVNNILPDTLKLSLQNLKKQEINFQNL